MIRHLSQALREWRRTLGAEFVTTEAAALLQAETATFETSNRVPAILRPHTVQEVRAVVRIAHQHNIPIYPVSTGMNWGYGSRVPANKAAVVVSLDRMNRIVALDEDLAYITVEPGVTASQVFSYLRRRKSGLIFSTTASSPDASLIGNALERGFAKGLSGERFSNVCAFEVVLASGEILHTSFDRYRNTKTAHVVRYASGPALEGLFSQGNLGIVTRMTFWLSRIPRYVQLGSIWIPDAHSLEKAIPRLRSAVAEGVIVPVFGFVNDYRAIASNLLHYPWKAAENATPLPTAVKRRYAEKFKFEEWQGTFMVPCLSKADARLKRTYLLKLLSPVVRNLDFYGAGRKSCLKALLRKKPPQSGWGRLLLSYLGYPLRENVMVAGWRKKVRPTKRFHPDLNRCGLIWVPASVPFDGKRLVQVVTFLHDRLLRGGFEPLISFSCLSERWIQVVAAISYDRDSRKDEKKAMVCYRQLIRSLHRMGYCSYRLSTAGMSALPQPRDDFGPVLKRLKRALDPKSILAPGRYIP